MNTENGKIESTHLGFLDNGCFTFYLTLEFEGSGQGSGQGFGGIVLGKSNTYDVVSGILKALKLEKWEELKGKNIRIKRDNEKEKIISIGHIIKDSWYDLTIKK